MNQEEAYFSFGGGPRKPQSLRVISLSLSLSPNVNNQEAEAHSHLEGRRVF